MDLIPEGLAKLIQKIGSNISGLSPKKIDLAPKDSVFEIVCGSGTFLYLWYKAGHLVGGIDYSENLISIAQRVMRGMNFQVSDAIDVNTDEKFDIVLSNGVFFYFRDYTYAKEVIERMIRKARKAVAIFDLSSVPEKRSQKVRGGRLSLKANTIKNMKA
jgi:2-polyprenyl-3-methyl-5-hydroxy-6-metoxy-1,4-benzoquinol methylase